MLVTLKDIAKKTGFSVNTVSRALRGMEDISEPTRKRIRAVAKEMGYISNATAASLRSGFSKTIAVIVSDISNIFFAAMMKQIETAATAVGYTALLLNTNEDELQELHAIQVALSQHVDGIILSPTQKSDANLDYLKKTGVPFVLIGRRNDDLEISSVVCDDELGGYLAAKHLIENGHRNILMLRGPLYISSSKCRLDGYRRAFCEANLPICEDLIREIPVTGAGHEKLAKLLSPSPAYTAVIAFSDILGWEIWSYLNEQGIRVPQECSVIGFDHAAAALTLPFRLSSVETPVSQISVAAVRLLLSLVRHEQAEPAQLVFPPKLAEGQTVHTI